MAATRKRLPEQQNVILIGDAEVVARAVRAIGPDYPVVHFDDLEQFDRWRSGAFDQPKTIQRELMKALREIDCQKYVIAGSLRKLFEWMAQCAIAPAVSSLEERFSSRRSFYRIWAQHIPESPAVFLGRVRLLHARRLIERSGMNPKEAAAAAGFASVQQFRKLLARRARIVASDLRP